jgi:hypothetical protein
MISSGYADGLTNALAAATGVTSAQISAATTILTGANAVVATAGPGAAVSPMGQPTVTMTQMKTLYPVAAVAATPHLLQEINRQFSQIQTAYRI